MNREQLIKVLSEHAEMMLEVLDADAAQCAAWRARGADATAAFADARVGRTLPPKPPVTMHVLRQALGPLALPGSRDPDPTPGGSADHAGYVPADWELGGIHCGVCGALDHNTSACPDGVIPRGPRR